MSSYVLGSFARRVACAALGIAALLVAAPSRAEVVFGNLGTSGSSGLAVGGPSVTDTIWVAQGFTVGGTNDLLTAVTLGLVDNDSTTARVQLFGSVAGQPAGSALATGTLAIPTGTPSLYTFNFNQQLTSGSAYWIVVSSADPGGAFNWSIESLGAVATAQNSSGWLPTAPSAVASTNGGSTWSTGDFMQQRGAISITAVPEPSTLALASIGVAMVVGLEVRRRRRRVELVQV